MIEWIKAFWFVPAAAVVVALIGWALVVAIQDHNAWEDDCKARGGHVNSHTDWVTSPGTYVNGTWHPGTSTANTTYFCFSNDGRILGID